MKFIVKMLICIFFSTFCYAKLPTLTKKMDECINTSICEIMRFKSKEQNPCVQCKKLTSKEVMEILKTDEDPSDPFYLIETKAFKPRTQYALYSVNMCLGKVLIDDLVTNAKGQLVSKKPASDSSGVFFNGLVLQRMSCFMNGESSSFAFVPRTGASCITITMTPNPIEHNWNDGSYTCLWMQSQDACNFILSGKGFKPNELLLMTSKSGDEEIKFHWKADGDGLLFSMIQPAVINKTGGQSSLINKREQTGEVGTLSYFWGSEAKPKNALTKQS